MSLNISIIQTSLHWENIEENIAMFSKKINELSPSCELVVLPETFTTGFSMKPMQLAETMHGKAIEWMKKTAKEKKIILTGSAFIQNGNNEYHNRLIWMLPNEQMGFYDKHHLFSYAEEDKHFTAGNKRLITQVKGFKILTQICYDLRFPVWNRMQTETEYDIILYVANWPEKRSHAWKTLLQARAIENQCYVIACNRIGDDENGIKYCGDSCIINPLGEVVAFLQPNEDGIINYTIHKEEIETIRNQFPFLKDKDPFELK